MPDNLSLSSFELLGFSAVALVASILLSRAMIAYAGRHRLVDVPNERSSHAAPTPRGGGLAVVIVFMAGLVGLALYAGLQGGILIAVAGSGLLAALVGFVDDHCHLAARWRASVHFAAAAWALIWLGGYPTFASGFTIGVVLGNIFWLVALVWFLNAFNFMDGIDGIAGAEGIFISGAAAVLLFLAGSGSLASVSLLLMFATAGFLVWNLPPARIFMGDVGSGFLGMLLGAVAIASVVQGSLTMWVFAILFAAFISDATITVARRILRGKRWHSAHRSHAYQHASRIYGSHGKVTAAVSAINVLWLFPLAFAAWGWPNLGWLFTAVAYAPLIVLLFCYRAGVEEVERGNS